MGRDNLNTCFFMNFAKYFLILESVEVEVQTVPHFKASVNATAGPGGLKCGGSFT